jgi:chromate reductase
MRARIARHTDDLTALVAFYRDRIGLPELGGFTGHDGYDGVFLDLPGTGAHLEFTTGGEHPAGTPHEEDLLVLYFDDQAEVDEIAARIGAAPVRPANPYWERHAVTFADPDGHHVVLVGPGADDTIRLLLVTGSTRRGSTNSAALRAAQELVPPGSDTVLHERLGALPQFDPDADHDPLPAPVIELRAAIARADAVVFCTPEYAGTLPGSFKNLLDWTVGGAELYRKPVTWINVAAPGRGSGADATLKTVLGYVGGAFLPSSGVRVNVPRDAVDETGMVVDEPVRAQLADALATIVDEVRAARDADS